MTIQAYHEASKHRPDSYADGPGYLDWASQPDPFRTFTGAPSTRLPLGGLRGRPGFGDIHSGSSEPAAPWGLSSLGAFLEHSLALSAWKALGRSRWSLRCNPSSGNLHPSEGYVVWPGSGDLLPGIYHYLSLDHSLERRAAPEDVRSWRAAFGEGGFLVGLSSIHWREAWKYGIRAYRYSQHDAGHALAALRYAAACLGWRLRLLPDWGDGEIETLLGLDRGSDFPGAEREQPDWLAWVGVGGVPPGARDSLLDAVSQCAWSGRANVLSPARREWAALESAAAAGRKPPTQESEETDSLETTLPPLGFANRDQLAGHLIRTRRSAVAFDGVTALSREGFFRVLDALLVRPGVPPFDALPFRPRIHLLVFVHRVMGIAPGLYWLPRSAGATERLLEACARDWLWSPVEGAPDHLPLIRLAFGDVRRTAKALSCGQDIAGDSSFSVGMLAEYGETLALGSWWYRRLFWEAGAVGQALYLWAEAEGLRGTGIGCFFDDEVHELIGLRGNAFQSLYHFTVGGAVEDGRLTTQEPYAHLETGAREAP
ncbi:MAG: SagB/ThcOx family dehydrogenase [Acidobacteriota bacterium]